MLKIVSTLAKVARTFFAARSCQPPLQLIPGKAHNMPLDWAPLVDVVRQHQRFLLTTPLRPDADGLGSLLALGEALELRGKEVRSIIASNWPVCYDFLDPAKIIERFTLPGDTWSGTDVIMVLDTGTWNQLGDFGKFLEASPAVKIVIDHHLSQNLPALRLVDTTAEATGRLIFEAIQALGGSLTTSMAHNLFAALATDTGWFRHSNTTAATFGLAQELVRAGARPTQLYDSLYEQNTLPRMKLTGLVVSRLQMVEDGRVAFTFVQREDYETTGASPQDTENLVNYTRGLIGVEVGLLFMEQPRGGVKVSFRSRAAVDVAKIAEGFGGGGHRLASGAVVDGSMTEAQQRVLAAVHQALQHVDKAGA
jgi:bifunctional oligoribonuclease and PAP phosphatase NrnA